MMNVLEHPSPPLRRQTQLGVTHHHHTPLKRGVPLCAYRVLDYLS